MLYLRNMREMRIWKEMTAQPIHMYGFFVFFLPIHLAAQTIPPDRETLEKSEGAGMAQYADVNGYPGPKHVLEMREELHLTDEQAKDIEAIFDEMSERSRAKGLAIIAEEQKLADLFISRKASQDRVEWLSSLIGTLRGELRAIHLTAHLQAAQVLSRDQCLTYGKLRHAAHMPGQQHEENK